MPARRSVVSLSLKQTAPQVKPRAGGRAQPGYVARVGWISGSTRTTFIERNPRFLIRRARWTARFAAVAGGAGHRRPARAPTRGPGRHPRPAPVAARPNPANVAHRELALADLDERADDARHIL